MNNRFTIKAFDLEGREIFFADTDTRNYKFVMEAVANLWFVNNMEIKFYSN